MRAIYLIQGPLRTVLLRQALFLVPSLGLAWLCLHNLALAPAELAQGLAEISAPRWGAAAAFTALSFWAVGRYDLLVHRHLGTGADPTHATRTGAAAIAVSQATGAGLVVGALVRWRLLPQLGILGALKFVALVSLTFVAAWATVTALAVLLTPALALPVPGARVLAACVVLGAVTTVLACLFRPGFCARLRLPSIRTLAVLLPLAAADLVAAGMAFICFLPALPALGVMEIMTAFSIAYGVGLLSGSPGGIGPFEIVLMALLPEADPATRLAAMAAWRIAYFALPALLGLIFLARGAQDSPAAPLEVQVTTVDPHTADLIAAAPRAEVGLLHAGHAGMLDQPGVPRAVTARGSHTLVLLSCLDDWNVALCGALGLAAKESGRIPCLYKIDAQQAVSARSEGWTVARCGSEAILDPVEWTEAGPERAGLRRKLRRAEKAGILASEVTVGSHGAELAGVDAAWCAAQGSARGFTMGLYTPEYVSHQRIFAASLDDRLCAFVTFHASRGEWVLDLVRQDGAPDGTIHALITYALAKASETACPRLSLASVPCPPAALPARLQEACARRMGNAGLAQFKQTFAPRWETRYIAAPGLGSLAISWADIARCIQHPPHSRPR
ncbi:phosphatidylglycerol lysyltransferase domain-containing protein [Palleronia sp.]|uniref:phosphatidylglycerol lysyltransferase domain-containing protein n=1 Tax=Palleronia sp. TaxID=1940284 RepID=UPI0035C7B1EE